MIEKAIEVMFKTAKMTIESIREAGTGEEIHSYSDYLENIVDGIHEIVKHMPTGGGHV